MKRLCRILLISKAKNRNNYLKMKFLDNYQIYFQSQKKEKLADFINSEGKFQNEEKLELDQDKIIQKKKSEDGFDMDFDMDFD